VLIKKTVGLLPIVFDEQRSTYISKGMIYNCMK